VTHPITARRFDLGPVRLWWPGSGGWFQTVHDFTRLRALASTSDVVHARPARRSTWRSRGPQPSSGSVAARRGHAAQCPRRWTIPPSHLSRPRESDSTRCRHGPGSVG
jgi:hypothetical protein